jgi:hypothetical protein
MEAKAEPMRRLFLLCVLCLLLFAPHVWGQNSSRPLTNADIVRLVKASIPDDTVVLAIQHGKCNFDTSPDALISLSREGVSKKVLDAMLGGCSSSTGTRTPGHQSANQNLNNDFAVAGLKALRGIEGTLGMPSIENGGIAVPRATQELIDNADAEARATEEKAVVKLLNKFTSCRS